MTALSELHHSHCFRVPTPLSPEQTLHPPRQGQIVVGTWTLETRTSCLHSAKSQCQCQWDWWCHQASGSDSL